MLMRRRDHRAGFLRWRLVPWLALGALGVTPMSTAVAIDPAKMTAEPEEEQRGGIAAFGANGEATRRSADVRERDRGAGDTTRRIDPQRVPGFDRQRGRRWTLGVRVDYLNTGARVTQVVPNTPAWRVGLEPDDVIVSVDGYQVGYVNRRLYDLGTELTARGGRNGRVRLLVQNRRNQQLINVDVRLSGDFGIVRDRNESPGLPRRGVIPGIGFPLPRGSTVPGNADAGGDAGIE